RAQLRERAPAQLAEDFRIAAVEHVATGSQLAAHQLALRLELCEHGLDHRGGQAPASRELLGRERSVRAGVSLDQRRRKRKRKRKRLVASGIVRVDHALDAGDRDDARAACTDQIAYAYACAYAYVAARLQLLDRKIAEDAQQVVQLVDVARTTIL